MRYYCHVNRTYGIPSLLFIYVERLFLVFILFFLYNNIILAAIFVVDALGLAVAIAIILTGLILVLFASFE